MALIDKLAPFMTPQADVAGALNSFADSIQAQNKTDAELRNQRELRQATLTQSQRAVAAENQRAANTIQAHKAEYEAGFAEKKSEQQQKEVDDAIAKLSSGDPSQHDLVAAQLRQHGVEMLTGEAPPSAPLPQKIVSPAMSALGATPLSVMMKPAHLAPGPAQEQWQENRARVYAQMHAPQPAPLPSAPLAAIGGPASSSVPAPAPLAEPATPSTKVRFVAGGRELGSFDPADITKSRATAIDPMFKALVENAAPLERPFYEQQIAAARANPEVMNLPAQTILTHINEAVKAGVHEEASTQRAKVIAGIHQDTALKKLKDQQLTIDDIEGTGFKAADPESAIRIINKRAMTKLTLTQLADANTAITSLDKLIANREKYGSQQLKMNPGVAKTNDLNRGTAMANYINAMLMPHTNESAAEVAKLFPDANTPLGEGVGGFIQGVGSALGVGESKDPVLEALKATRDEAIQNLVSKIGIPSLYYVGGATHQPPTAASNPIKPTHPASTKGQQAAAAKAQAALDASEQ